MLYKSRILCEAEENTKLINYYRRYGLEVIEDIVTDRHIIETYMKGSIKSILRICNKEVHSKNNASKA